MPDKVDVDMLRSLDSEAAPRGKTAASRCHMAP